MMFNQEAEKAQQQQQFLLEQQLRQVKLDIHGPTDMYGSPNPYLSSQVSRNIDNLNILSIPFELLNN